jgi:uncharacterized LabA/DUF88 family protein
MQSDQPMDGNMDRNADPGIHSSSFGHFSFSSSAGLFPPGQDNWSLPGAHNSRIGEPRIAILVDGASLFYAALQLQVEIDYLKLLHYLRGNRQLLRAYFYTGSDRSNERQQGFLLWMRRNGYRVVTKDLVTLPDGSRKANLDVEIAIDMMTLGNYCDTIVLLSGTGDLSYAVNALSYRGVKIEIVSLRANTNDQLINLADRFVDLADIQALIRKTSEPSTN